ncbi:hypothetical protein GCM10007047_05730 [Cerasicoccus arenae]|uniref:Site-specific integrase n=1 Tax=Cerasicoccus arenae TaxID=424488 RepID=A0A8J3DFM3_9BACT|nr:hypothetical protein GCM10007047_05730 [Cerasicoccus arenae]
MISHVYKPKRKKNGKTIVSRNYRGRYRLDGDFAVTEIALRTTDKQVAEKRLAEIIKELEQERVGIIAPKLQRDSAEKSLESHVKDFLADLRAIGRTDKHIDLLRRRFKRLISDEGWTRLSDVTANNFTQWRSAQADLKPKTLNDYLSAAHSLMNWLKDQGRITDNPLDTIKKVDTRGKQAKRRAFTDDELQKLLAIAGSNRLLYLTAAYTGLRLGELRQVLRADVVFDRERPHIKARAITTKNRKDALVPLHPLLVEEFNKVWPKNPQMDEPVFTIIKQPDAQFRRHLERAGIARIDALGRKVDFHALRYTFATKLAKSQVSQRLAQELMRHSDPKLTAMIYTDATQLPTFDAVASIGWHQNDCKPTVEDDPQIDPQNTDFWGLSLSQFDKEYEDISIPEILVYHPLSPALAPVGTGGQMVLRAGVEPAHPKALPPEDSVSANSTT